VIANIGGSDHFNDRLNGRFFAIVAQPSTETTAPRWLQRAFATSANHSLTNLANGSSISFGYDFRGPEVREPTSG